MAKIINFQEARRKFELAGLVSALKWEQIRGTPPEPKKPYTGPTKRPLIVSALPGKTIPPEFPDFRPLLQRDGLILLGWSRWDLALYHYKGPRYAVTWITSALNRHHRRYTSGYITEEEISTARPDGTGDSYFLLGIRGKIYDFKNVHDKDVADYLSPALSRN